MASIEEVAREARVSITTVSHVFSGKRPVAPETRRRVLATAERLGHRPHRAARGLATGRAMTIGLHFPFGVDSFLLDPYFPDLLEGLSAAAAEAGYGFLLIPTSPGVRFPLKLALAQRRFDGVIIANPAADSPLIPQLVRHQTPVVTIGRYLGPHELAWVDSDLRDGIAQTMAHLDVQGYRRPALISLRSTFSCNQDVEESFEKEVQARGGEVSILRASELSENQGFRSPCGCSAGPYHPMPWWSWWTAWRWGCSAPLASSACGCRATWGSPPWTTPCCRAIRARR